MRRTIIVDDSDNDPWTWKTNADGVLTTLSRNFLSVLGQRVSGVAFRSKVTDFFISPEHGGAYDQVFRDFIQERRPFNNFIFTLQHHKIDVNVQISGQPVVVDGKFEGFAGTGICTNAAHTHYMNSELSAQVTEQLSHGIAIFNEKNCLMQANQAFVDIFTNSSNRIYPGMEYKNFCRLLLQYKDVSSQNEAQIRALLDAIQSKNPVTLDLNNQKTIFIEFKALQKKKTLCVINDITHHTQEYEKLRHQFNVMYDKLRLNDELMRRVSIDDKVTHDINARMNTLKEEFKRLYAADNSCIMRVNEDGLLHSASPALCRMLGFMNDHELRQFLRNPHKDLYLDINMRAELEAECREHGAVRDQILHWRHLGSGSTLVVSETMLAVYREGVFQYFESHIVDMTDSYKLSQQLESVKAQARADERQKAHFLYHMSHEMRTPLNAVMGFADILHIQTQKNGHAQYNEYLTDITGAGQSLLGTIDDMLLLLSLSKADYALEDNRFAPCAIVTQVFERLKLETARHDLNVQFLFNEHCPDLYADEKIFTQCVRRILDNAIKFTPEHGWIKVTVYSNRSNEICVRISDNGAGIDDKKLSHVLKPFHYGSKDPALTTVGEGVGVGLSIVNSFMTAHEGDLIIKSHDGVGTTVTLRFPSWRTRRYLADSPDDYYIEENHFLSAA